MKKFKKKKMRNKPKVGLDLGVEALEQRKMLAGNVTATITGAGDLVVKGDSADNNIAIEIDSFGNVSITGNEGTNVQEKNLSTTLLSGDIRVSMLGGNDSVVINGADYDVPVENISILTGTGDDTAVVTNMDGIDGNVRLNTGVGNDIAGVKYAGVTGNVSVSSGAGNDQNVIGDVAASNITVLSGSGNDQDTLYGVTANGKLTISSTSGNDSLSLTESVALDTSVSTGLGNDKVLMDGFNTKYDMKVNTSGGDDEFVITNATVSGDLLVNTGAGNDQLGMKYANTGVNGRTRINTGTGDDVFQIGDSDLGDSANILFGGGADTMNLVGPVSGSGLVNGGSGIDSISGQTSLDLGQTGFEKYGATV